MGLYKYVRSVPQKHESQKKTWGYLKNMKTKKKTGGNLKTLCSLSEQCKTSNYKHMLGLSITNMEKKQEAEQCNTSNYKIMLGLSLTNMKTKKKNRRQPQNPHNHKQCQVFHEQTNKPKTKPLMQFDISTTF